MKTFRRPNPKQPELTLTDKRARTLLSAVVPITEWNGTVYKWQFVGETRTKSGTLAYIYRDPLNAASLRVWAVDFATGTCRDIGPAHAPKPPPVRALPQPTLPLLLPPPPQKHRGKKLAEQIGEAFLRGFRGRMQ